ncbi:uncharacterized protein LOC131941329 [Physella acuta]|uniref:uncharacterized protein LOC131941329 n=1 Tax=Physella acuta TaxID=109671 RepID=UPI0027DB2730|nr:uncharacterized protein LOC131941329 [Physella acuta]
MMPYKLIPLDHGKLVLSPGDKGFLISLSKLRWNKPAGMEIIKLFKSYTQQYFEKKCAEKNIQPNEEKTSKLSNSDGKKNCEEAPNSSGIEFIQRELVYHNCGFIACNLEEPSEFAHFVLSKLSELKTESTSKFPFRIMPVEEVCEAKPKALEKAVLPLIEKTLGSSQLPLRFSLLFRGNNEMESLTQQDAKAIVRNCVWAVNPSCVQCIKYQDYAVVMHMLPPLLLIGVCQDFQRLAGYNTWTIRQGPDLTDLGEDSEDEISDDPNLEEEEEKRRKLRIKRKRRAEKAGLGQPDESIKTFPDEMEDDEAGVDCSGDVEDGVGVECSGDVEDSVGIDCSGDVEDGVDINENGSLP